MTSPARPRPLAHTAPARATRPGRQRPPRPVGRPRSRTADQAILDAAAGLLQDGGAEGLTVSAVVARSGVARATVYRRFPSRELLLSAAIRAVKGRAPHAPSGNLQTDLALAVEGARVVLGVPQFRAVLPALVRDLLLEKATEGVSEAWNRISPNHRRFAEEYATHAAADGLRPEVDGYVPGNIIFGAMLAALLSTGRPPTREMADQVVEVLLNGLRPR